MSIDLREELTRAAERANPGDCPEPDYAGDLARGRARLRRHRVLAVATTVPVLVVVLAVVGAGVRLLPFAEGHSSPDGQSSLSPTPSAGPSSATPSAGSSSPTPSAGPSSATPTGSPTPSGGPGWSATQASLRRSLHAALGRRVQAGEAVWFCNGSTGGRAALVYWSNTRGVAFGDPAQGDHVYLYAAGTTRAAYPSQVWRAIAAGLVPPSTAQRITTWLQQHDSGSTRIDGLRVEIDGPIAGVSLS